VRWETEHLNTNNESYNKNDLINWRREKILLLSSQGYSQRDIADKIKVSVGTVNKDLSFLRDQAKENIKKYVDEKIPEEYEKCLTGISTILKESWNIANNATDKREKMQALYLAKECYSQKLDLLTNSNVINDSMRFIEKSKENLSNKKEVIVQKGDIQGSSKINNEVRESQYNQTF
jgi:IS30 family transposase